MTKVPFDTDQNDSGGVQTEAERGRSTTASGNEFKNGFRVIVPRTVLSPFEIQEPPTNKSLSATTN